MLSSSNIKDTVDMLSRPSSLIFNQSFAEGIFLEILKIVQVTPINKKEFISTVSNYSQPPLPPPLPLSSLLLFFSKIIESSMHSRIYSVNID